MNIGLCAACDWMRRLGNNRGSTFFLCGRAKLDHSFPKYPRLPVLHCAGYQPLKSTDPPRSSGEAPPDRS